MDRKRLQAIMLLALAGIGTAKPKCEVCLGKGKLRAGIRRDDDGRAEPKDTTCWRCGGTGVDS